MFRFLFLREPGFSFLTPLVLSVVLILTGCADGTASEPLDGRPARVVTTTSMLADLAREIGGEEVEVNGLMAPGVDPHLYRASEGDVSRMNRADIIFFNGIHLEGRMTEVFRRMKDQGRRAVAVAEEAIPPGDRIESPEFGGSYDPHVWFDVSMWMEVARRVEDELAELMPDREEIFAENLERYLDELQDLQNYAEEETQRIPEDQRVLITSHDAFGYFGRQYDFEVRGLQGISTDAEAGTGDVQRLAAFITERRIPAIFAETSVSPRGIEAVREAVRSRGHDVILGGTLYGDALGEEGTEEGTYIGAMRHNIDTIVAGLLGEA